MTETEDANISGIARARWLALLASAGAAADNGTVRPARTWRCFPEPTFIEGRQKEK